MNKVPRPRLNFLDKAISVFSPERALKRAGARMALSMFSDPSGYLTPGSQRRTMRGWLTRAKTADQDILPKSEKMRAGARDAWMNAPLASAALRRIRTSVIGDGLRLQSRIDRKFLGLSDEAADRWEEGVEREWRTWAETTFCDITRAQNFYGLQNLAFMSTLMNGDCFVILRNRSVTGSMYKTRVMLIEADQVSNPNRAMDTDKLAGGIEIDPKDGTPVAYHIKKQRLITLPTRDDWVRVPAFGTTTGRRNVLHLLDKERVGQRRGVSILAPVIEPLKQITRLGEAELMASIIGSFFTVFVRSQTGNIGLQTPFIPPESALNPSEDGSSGRDATRADDNQYEIASGNIIELAEDQDISLAESKHPNSNYDVFFTSIVQEIAASLELPYELLMLRFTASYSASRGAIQEAWKMFRARRMWTAFSFCQPVFEEWLTESVILGRIGAPGFLEDPVARQAWAGSHWSGMGMGQIDPLKETKAADLRIKSNLSTHEDEYSRIQTGDWRGTMERKARENRFLETQDLTATVDTGEPNAAEEIDDANSDGR